MEDPPNELGQVIRQGLLKTGFLGVVRPRHLVVLLGVFMVVSLVFSNHILDTESRAATDNLKNLSASTCRRIESHFEELHDDFKLLVSIGALEAFFGQESPPRSDVALVKRFFARHQDSVARIVLISKEGSSVCVEILPGNYLAVNECSDPGLRGAFVGSPSFVSHEGPHIYLGESVPEGDAGFVRRAVLQVEHDRLFKSELSGQVFGVATGWVWSMNQDSEAKLLFGPVAPEADLFSVDAASAQQFRGLMEEGLEGVLEHEIRIPEATRVISNFSPLMIGGEPMAVIFSIRRDEHLAGLNRLSFFLVTLFVGTLALMLGWFAVSYSSIKGSQHAEMAARVKAEEAAKAKNDFVAAMSHEIRTPLYGVLGYAQLLDESGLTTEQSRWLEVIRSSGDHLLSVLNEILDFSRIEAGSVALRRERFVPADLTRGVMDGMASSAGSRNLALRLDCSRDLPREVVGDAGRLRQVLFNLIGNAIKFTHVGEVSVSVAFEQVDATAVLVFSVEDTGIGIPDDALESLFEPFSQVDSSASRGFGGSGLGLAICKKLIKQMNGSITVSSRPDVGSRFLVKVPVAAVATPGGADDGGVYEERNLLPVGGCPPGNASDESTVLVVDDSQVNSALLEQLLRRRGVPTEVASGGAEALEITRRRRFSLVLMDIEMPGLDGLEVVREIRCQERSEGSPAQLIFGLSAHAFEEARERALAAGMDDYFTKPLDGPDLDRIVAMVKGCRGGV